MMLRVFFSLLLAAGAAYAGEFTPREFSISIPQTVHYQFDGGLARIPVTVSGSPAIVTLAIFSKDQSYHLNGVRNGYLGWHYVNRIDTCVAVCPPERLEPGRHTLVWNGRHQDGAIWRFDGFLTYYAWGYNVGSPPQRVTDAIRFTRFDRSSMLLYDSLGMPLARPVLYSGARQEGEPGEHGWVWNVRTRWVIGDDPENPALAETTRYRSGPDRGRMAVDPNDPGVFLTQFLHTAPPVSPMVTARWRWVSGGDAVLMQQWGEDGYTYAYTDLDSETGLYSGPVTDGTYLYSTNMSGNRPLVDVFDIIDGILVQRLDLSGSWLSSAGEPATPSAISWNRGKLHLASAISCLYQALDPLAGMDNLDFLPVWENGLGDGVGDQPGLPALPNPASCHFPDRSPMLRGVASDADGFALFFDESLPGQFGLLAPDGTGMGVFPLPGLEGGTVYALQAVDTGSAYDGLYYGGVTATGDTTGVWYTGFDSVKGRIGAYIDVWGPFITIIEPMESDVLIPDAKTIISWVSGETESMRIDLSTDGGTTWTTLADSVPNTGSWLWTVPPVRSERCILRLTDLADPSNSDNSWPFTIESPLSVSDAAPAPFALRPNMPNPFNPSTTLSFTLPAPGNVSLTVYDITGRTVTELLRGFFSAGEHSAVWNAKGCASGVYFAVLKAGERTETRKMLLVR